MVFELQRQLRLLVTVFGLVFVHQVSVSQTGSSADDLDFKRFWVFNDFHLNITDLRPYIDGCCDSPRWLVNSTLRYAKRIAEPDFIVLLGDMVWHMDEHLKGNRTEMFLKTMQASVSYVRTFFPNIPIFPVIGNHDQIPPCQIQDDQYYNELIEYGEWGMLLGNQSVNFKRGGYYAVPMSPKLKLIFLNDIVYMKCHDDGRSSVQSRQLEWLRTVLQDIRSANGKAVVFAHTPYGLGNNFFAEPVDFLKKPYSDEIVALVTSYSDVIQLHMWGHQHSDQLKICSGYGFFGHVLPSVSPMSYGSKPSIRLWYYDDNGLVDYDQHTMLIPFGRELSDDFWSLTYSFRSAYELPKRGLHSQPGNSRALSPVDFQHVLQRIMTDNRTRQEYMVRVHAYAQNVTSEMEKRLVCLIRSFTEDEYSKCMDRCQSFETDCITLSLHQSRTNWFAVSMSAFIICLMTLMSLVLLAKCWSRKSFASVSHAHDFLEQKNGSTVKAKRILA